MTHDASTHDFILTLSCPDRIGITHAVSGWLLNLHGNIMDTQQFGDSETRRFFLRAHFRLPEPSDAEALSVSFSTVTERFDMDARFHDASRRARLLILVSRQAHCLNDLLFRMRNGDLRAEAMAIVSNHLDCAELAASYGVPFHHLPVTPDTRDVQESRILEIAQRERAELVVLARYMQILSADLCGRLANQAINIHHSFLPGFKGARPYHQAHARGVKIIGATAHYVTPDLDEGPIIEQDVQRVDHTAGPEELARVGRDIESRVLARAVRSHVEHRVLPNGIRTVVFR